MSFTPGKCDPTTQAQMLMALKEAVGMLEGPVM